jgi:hypothetical protein
MPLLLGALLMAILVGVAGARPSAKPLAAAWMNHTVSAHHCIPRWDYVNWAYDEDDLHCDTATCQFYCPIRPPHEGSVRIQRLVMYAFDNAGGPVCIVLREHRTTTGNAVNRLAWTCTDDSANDPETYSYDHRNFTVSRTEDVYVYVAMDSTGQKLYGFKIRYVPL